MSRDIITPSLPSASSFLVGFLSSALNLSMTLQSGIKQSNILGTVCLGVELTTIKGQGHNALNLQLDSLNNFHSSRPDVQLIVTFTSISLLFMCLPAHGFTRESDFPAQCESSLTSEQQNTNQGEMVEKQRGTQRQM